MKKNVYILIIAMFFTYSCTTMMNVGSKHKKYGSTIEVIENGASTRIEYKSYNQCLIELNNEANNEMWSETKINQQKKLLPAGGYVIVHVSGSTIGSANTKWWKYVVQSMEGKELLRKNGKDDIPEFTSSQYGTIWWNIDMIYLREPMNKAFKVYIINSLSQKRSGFIVYPNQILN